MPPPQAFSKRTRGSNTVTSTPASARRRAHCAPPGPPPIAGTPGEAEVGDHKGKRVAVIGGGPGGAQCARRLAEAGVDVTVFEPRVRFEKACGGGIPARGLERYPFLLDTGLAGKAVRECLVVAPSGREARFTLEHPLYV